MRWGTIIVLFCCTATGSAYADSAWSNIELNIEVGAGMPSIVSDASTVVVNNVGPGPFSPLTRVLGTDFIDAGHGLALGFELSGQHQSGHNLYIEVDFLNAHGSEAFPVFAGTGAIPGSFDDGFLLESSFNPVFRTDTRTSQLTIGRKSSLSERIDLRFGLSYGSVYQDAQVNYDAFGTSRQVSGRAKNNMLGVSAGASYSHPVSERLTLGLNGNISVFDNNYDYSYRLLDLTNSFTDQSLDASGNTKVVRLAIEATGKYALRDGLFLTGTLGIENYNNVATGLENMLNPNSTATTFSEATGTIRNSYARVGVTWTF